MFALDRLNYMYACSCAARLVIRDVHSMGMGMGFPWEWEHKYANNGNGNGYSFTRARIPIGRLTLANLGARYGQSDVIRELPDRTHWLGMFQI